MSIRSIIVTICLSLTLSSLAQTMLVPYRIGQKYGLSNELGTIVVKPAYDDIEYLENNYFQYTNLNKRKDTLNEYFGIKKIEERNHPTFGLFFKSKLIIAEQPFEHFLIYKHCIIGSENPYHAKYCTLFNLKGQNLFKKTVKGMYVNDERDIGNLSTLSDKHTLLSVFDKDEEDNRIFSLVVYDNTLQKITSWLIKEVENYKYDEYKSGYDYAFCTYSDNNGFKEKYICFINNQFVLKDVKEAPEEMQDNKEHFGTNSPPSLDRGRGSTVIGIEGESDNFEGNPEGIRKPKEIIETEDDLEKKGYLFYTLKQDSLFYVRKQAAAYLKMLDGATAIYYLKEDQYNQYDKKRFLQKESVIYKKQGKFGLIIRGVFQDKMYDSLVYFGHTYIAGISQSGQLKFGIINNKGIETVPFVYDSIQGQMKEIGFESIDKIFPHSYKIILREKDASYSRNIKSPYVKKETPFILAFMNGKVGIIGENNQIIIPLEYDTIASNGYHSSGQKQSDYIILRKAGKFAITNLSFNYRDRTYYENVGLLSPFFKYYPIFYIPDYYNKRGFKLYGLYDSNFNFMGYANSTGFKYFRDK